MNYPIRDLVAHQMERDGPAFVLRNDPDIPAPTFLAKGDDRPLTFQEAQLFAAAPELLAALKALLRHCVTPSGLPDKGKGRTAEQQAALNATAAAIAKAEGRL